MQYDACRFLHERSHTHKPLVAISACLTGAAVRYDGSDKCQPGLAWLRDEIELLPICPELEAGLGVPRPPVQLVQHSGGVRALGRDDSSLDVTDALTAAAQRSSAQLRALPLCGYLWKSRSPSCGLGSTPLFDRRGQYSGQYSGQRIGSTSGLQAHAVATALPWLAMAEEGVLQSERLAGHFLFGCRLVFDCLHAGTATTAQVAHHYRALLAALDSRQLATLLARDDLPALVTLLVKQVMAELATGEMKPGAER